MAKERELNEQQKLFCKYYVSEEFFASGVEAYAMAYGKDLTNQKDYNVSKSNAYRLLTNADILSYINDLIDDAGLNDSFVDKQLLFAITQNADISSKVKAIGEYNKLRQRITEKSKVESTGELIVKYVDGVKPA